ncbi:MAG: TlpA disulfide reductase family protein [Candidatus Limnocylindrales bacterium]
MSAAPSAGRSRPGLIGPFSGRQIALTLLVMAGVALALVIATSPIPAPTAAAPSIGSGFVPVGPATDGLHVGQRAPELAGSIATDNTAQPLELGLLVAGLLAIGAGLILARRSRVALLVTVAGVIAALVAVPLLLAPTAPPQTVQLTDLDGHPLTLADFQGRPIWLNFFATWCPPCQQETPTLQKLYQEHASEGLVLLGVSVQETSAADVRAYAQRYSLTFPIGFDVTSAVFKAYLAYGLPTQVFIDRDGVVRSVVRGPVSELTGEQNLAPILSQH